MKYRLIAKKFYVETTSKTRLDIQYDYDASGELVAERLLNHTPCFAHSDIQSETYWRRKILILNCGQDLQWDGIENIIKFGFLFYCVIDNKLLPLITFEQYIKAKKISDETLEDLLKEHQFQLKDVHIIKKGGPNDCFYHDIYPEFTAWTQYPKSACIEGFVYLYRSDSNKVIYSMRTSSGMRVQQITNIDYDSIDCKIGNQLRNIMTENGHLDGYVDFEASHKRLIVQCESPESKTNAMQLLLAYPKMEVLTLKNAALNEGVLPDNFNLPNLQTLELYRQNPENKPLTRFISAEAVQKLIRSAPNLHTCRIENVIPYFPVNYKLLLNASIKYLKISMNMLRIIELPSNNSLVVLEITASNYDEAAYQVKINPIYLENLVQQCPYLELIWVTDVQFHFAPRDLPSHIAIEYSPETLNQFKLDADVPIDTHENILKTVRKKNIITKMIPYFRLQGVSDKEIQPYFQQVMQNSDEILVYCFIHILSKTHVKILPPIWQEAWHTFLIKLQSWNMVDLPPEDSLLRDSLEHLWNAAHTILSAETPHYRFCKPVFSLSMIFEKKKWDEIILSDGDITKMLVYRHGYWYLLDTNATLSQLQIFAAGDEERLRKTIEEDGFQGGAFYARTSYNDVNLNPFPSSELVLDYFKRGGLLHLFRYGDWNALSFLNINALTLSDLEPLFACNQDGKPVYVEASKYNPDKIKKMLQRYQQLVSDFVIPELDISTHDTESQPKLNQTLLSFKPNKTSVSLDKVISKVKAASAPINNRKFNRPSVTTLPEEWKDIQTWFIRPNCDNYSQRFFLNKLQDYLVLQYGMNTNTWKVLNTLEQGIERAVACCFADYWIKTKTQDPQQIINGWKKAVTPLKYWQAQPQLSTRDVPLVQLLQNLWYYSYHMYFSQKPIASYTEHQSVQNLDDLFSMRPKQPFILANTSYATVLWYCSGIWYYFDPLDPNGEPQYFRRGDEKLLKETIMANHPGDWVVSMTHDAEHSLSLNSQELSAETNLPLPTRGEGLMHDDGIIDSEFSPLFPLKNIALTKESVDACHSDFTFLCDSSIAAYMEEPSCPKKAEPDEVSPYENMSLQEFDTAVLTRTGKNILLKFTTQAQSCLYLDHLLSTPQAQQRGLWIVNNLRDLQCAVGTILILPNNSCVEKPAPAGEFYDLLQTHPQLIIAVNWNGFTFQEMVQANSLIDEVEQRRNDNISIPLEALVLSFQNIGDPDAYTEKDFTTRHDEEIDFPKALKIPNILDFYERNQGYHGDQNKSCPVKQDGVDAATIEIDFYQNPHWQNYLYGILRPYEDGMRFVPGALMLNPKPDASAIKIIFRNAPLKLPAFRQAVYTLLYTKRLRYCGREVCLPQTIHIDFIDGFLFALEPYVPIFTQKYTKTYQHELNPSTLNDFFVQYEFTPQGIVTKPSVLQTYANQPLTVYVSRNISIESWSRLLKEAQTYHCQITFSLDLEITLPAELTSQKKFVLNTCDDLEEIEIPYVETIEGYDRIISLAGLNAQDLFYKVYFDEDHILREKISDNWQFLREVSTETHQRKVLLVGNAPPKLMDVLKNVLVGRGYSHNGTPEHPIGQLNLLHPTIEKTTLAHRPKKPKPIPSSLPPDEIDHSDDLNIGIVHAFNLQRHQQISAAFNVSRLVCILGHTGRGKSHFMKAYPGVIYEDIARWIREGGILFIDEANLKQWQWDQFESLMWDPPSIFYEGKYYPLTDNHFIAVAMNPSDYSKDRETPELFETYAETVIFTDFPNAYLYHEMLLPILGDCQGHELLLGKLFLQVYRMVRLIENSAFTVRELQMMAFLYKATHTNLFPDDDQVCALYHAYTMAMQCLSTEKHRKLFHTQFIEQWRTVPKPQRIYPSSIQGDENNFELVASHHAAYDALADFMAVRTYRQKNPKLRGGLFSLILKGLPGNGKSLFLKNCLIYLGFKEGVDFYYIPAKWPPEKKKQSLLLAQKEKKIALKEEFNASVMISDVLNAVLSEDDMAGHTIDQAGFVVLGTENFDSMQGREKASLSTQRRRVSVSFPQYTLAEAFHILIKKDILPNVAYDAIGQLWQDPSLGFRGIYKYAKNCQTSANVTVLLPDIFWHLYRSWQPLSLSDQCLFQTLQKKRLKNIFYQGEDGQYYFHDFVYRNLKKQYADLKDLSIRVLDNSLSLLRDTFHRLTYSKVRITPTVFAHIELDMEMPGLVGLQGESEEHIFGCFAEYVAERGLTDPRILKFYQAVNALLMHAKTMQSLNEETTRSRSQFYSYCDDMANRINQLGLGNDIFFTGGWYNPPPGSSHSMIYRFTRSAKGLQVLICNAGAGLSEHEKLTDEHGERYYPVKIYEIPDPLDLNELALLIRKMLLPKLLDHPAITHQDCILDATDLYRNLGLTLEHMNAQQILAVNLFDSGVTTQGVLAGACTLAIQQLLNCYLNDPLMYLRIMFDVKLYVLQNFIAENPAPRPQHINQLLILAIENNLKIWLNIKQKGIEDWLPKNNDPALYLRNLKQQINTEECLNNAVFPCFESTGVQFLIDWIPEVIQQPVVNLVKNSTIEPLGELMMIEEEILKLTPDVTRDSYSLWRHSTHTYTLTTLENLQKSYQNAYEKCYGTTQLPRLFVIQACLLHACARISPQFMPCFSKEIGAFFSAHRYSPYLATHDMVWDEKLIKIMEAYPYQPLDYDMWIIDRYREILRSTDPKLISILTQHYWEYYGKSTQSMHVAIRTQHLQALYALCEELTDEGALRSNSKLNKNLFAPLIGMIQNQIRMERFIVRCFQSLLNKPLCGMVKPEFGYHFNRLKIMTQLTRATPSQHRICADSTSVMNHIYHMPKSPEKQILQEDSPNGVIWIAAQKNRNSENDIQLKCNQNGNSRIRKLDFYIRELAHLRLEPEYQVILTLNYFLTATQHINNMTTQQYIEANIFQPGLLLRHRNDQNLIEKWDKFIAHGLNECRDWDGGLSPSSLYLLRLRFYFNRYFNYVSRLREDLSSLDDLLKNEQNQQRLSSLHQYRFLTILACNLPELLPNAYESYVYSQAVGGMQTGQDTASEDEVHRAQQRYKQWLSKIGEAPQVWMNKTLVKYPRLLNDTVDRVDLIKGKLYSGDYVLQALPAFLQQQPMLQRLGIPADVQCRVSQDESIYLLTISSKIILRILKFNDRLIYQKKWMIDFDEAWYQLCPLSFEQIQHFRLDPEEKGYPCIEHHLPNWLTDDQTQAWVDIRNKQTILLVQDDQIRYVWHSNKSFSLIRNNQFASLIDLPASHKLHLLQFENAQFIVHSQNHDANIIDFIRYGLQLSYNNLTNEVLNPENKTILTRQSASPFAPNVACLTFSRDEKMVECLVPIQPFYVLTHEVQELGQYYPLVHDISRHGPAAQMAKYWHDHGIPMKDRSLWHFAHSEKYVRFRMVDDQPKADCAEHALYLCYLYLATHDLTQAWKILNDLNRCGGLSGTYMELTYLSWIINKLPEVNVHTAYVEERSRNESLKSPRYIACKLKALSLLVNAIQYGKVWEVPNDKPNSTANSHYAILQQQEVRKFYTNLPCIVADMYEKFMKIQKYLSQKFELDCRDLESLLTYIDCTGNSAAHGPLGYARLELSLASLLKLETHLLALKRSMGKQWSVKEEQRLQQIQKKLHSSASVKKKSTKLTYAAIDLSLPDYFSTQIFVQGIIAHYIHRMDLFNVQHHDEEAINLLSSAISDQEFIEYMPNFIRVARQESFTTVTVQQRKRLRQFCLANLRAGRHIALAEQDSAITYLSNILYRILENPRCLDKLSSCTWLDCFKLALELKVTPVYMPQAKDDYESLLTTAAEMVTELRAKMTHKELIPVQQESIEKWQIHLPWLDEYREANKLVASETEEAAGMAMFKQMQEKQRLAKLYLSDSEQKFNLTTQIICKNSNLEITLDKLWKEIEALAHKMPQNETFSNELAAASRDLVQKEELLKLYLHQDRAGYYRMTALTTSVEVDALHVLLHKYVSLSVQNQKLKRIMKALNDNDFFEIAEALIQENPQNAVCDPCLMLFQYLENKMIRPRQMEAVQRLLEELPNGLGFREIVEKILMGGGKSKLVLPIVAQKKAKGTNLVVIEVQRALLKTQHAEMNHLSQDLFNQTGHLFEFDRDSDCSAARLKQIYAMFEKIMIHQDYLVTTGEAMQSLHLKYRELLHAKPPLAKDWPQWREQVTWAEKIVIMLKEHGDAIIDEVHEGLRQNKKRNYTFGQALPVDAETIKLSIQLYEFIDFFPECAADGTLLIDKLLQEPRSPLLALIPRELLPVIRNYLHNSSRDIPPQIFDLNPKLRNALAFFKEQALVLPKTAALKYKEKYGPSKKNKKNIAEQALAIPYFSNNKPNEHGRFAHVLKTINCTIQGLLKGGLDECLLQYAIAQWQAQARQMMKENELRSPTMNDTPIAHAINELLDPPFSLQTLDINRSEDQKYLRQLLKNKSFIYKILKDFVLPCVQQEQSVLHGDSYDHVDLYRSVQALSGTPKNHATFKRVRYDESTALGNDAYIQKVIEEKVHTIRTLEFDDLYSYIKALEPCEPTHALIDICARFAGFDAIEVAMGLSRYFAEKGSVIEYVLYFNEDDILCALPVHGVVPIMLGTTDTDEICKKLGGCTLDKCFTYYDQPRALGTDLTQVANANAIVLIDEYTYLQNFFQGCTRMRGVEKNQTLELVGTPKLQGQSMSELLIHMRQIEDERLLEDNVPASLSLLENTIKLDLENRILALDSNNVDLKHRYMLAFEQFFFDIAESKDNFAKYGGMYYAEDVERVLKNHRNKILRDWETCLSKVHITPIYADSHKLTDQMDAIIREAVKICPKKTLHKSGQQHFDQDLETEKEMEVDLEELDEYYDASLKPIAHEPWDSEEACPLNTWIGHRAEFSNNLFYSPNFAQVYQGQVLKLDPYVKPVHIVYFVKQWNKITACLITQREAQEIKKQNPNGQWWLSTTQHDLLGGEPPEGIKQNEQYLSLIEQIRYFNGELNLQLKDPASYWLKNQPEEKVNFYNKGILPHREATYVRADALDILTSQNISKTNQNEIGFVNSIISLFTKF